MVLISSRIFCESGGEAATFIKNPEFYSVVLNRSTMKRALLAIDVQNEHFTGQLPVTYPPDILKNSLKNSLNNILEAMQTAST